MSASLWLVPREGIPFTKEVQELISKTIPSNFSPTLPKHQFTPHVTVTSGIDPKKTYESSSPQEWLDSLSLPVFKKEFDEVLLELDHIEAGEAFFKKLNIHINPNDNLIKLAAQCRREGVLSSPSDEKQSQDDIEQTAQTWAKKEFLPHLSLMYSDLPMAEVKKKVPLVELQIGWGLGSLFDCCGGTLSQGGNLVLVNTYDEIKDWKVLASREAPWAMWKMSRNLC